MYRSRDIELFEKLIHKPVVRNLDDVRALGREVSEEGYKSLKTNLLQFEAGKPARIGRGVGPIELNITVEIIRQIVDLLSAFRDGAGSDVGLMMDLNFNYKTEGFRQIAQAVEPLGMMWLEIDSLDPVGLADIRRSTTSPISGLETVLGRRALQPYLDARSVDIPIVDAVYNGMIEAYKMAAQLDAYELNVAPHNSHGPLGTLISGHFSAVIPNFRILEYDVDEVPWRRQLLTEPWTIENGELLMPTGPGWGADIDEEVLHSYPPKQQRA
jgi:L-alanine-DL-glutamate epimerase-like enolase superfamily enzyme